MTHKPVKVLAVGDVNGRFNDLLKRVNTINKKSGPFDALFCVGEFFGPDEAENLRVTSGELQFPVSTYILGPCCPSTSACYPEGNTEFSSNLTYLGRRGVLTTAAGLTIGYLSGIEATGDGPVRPFEFTEKFIDDLMLPVRAQSGFLGVDLLLTSIWPAEVAKHSTNTPSMEISGSKHISRLASGLKPRYHFAGQGCHFERAPYRNHRVLVEAAQHPTRFIGLAAVGNTTKAKWIYAVSVVPMRKMTRDELTAQPSNVSEFPYMGILEEYVAKQKATETKRPDAQFFFDTSEDALSGSRKRGATDDEDGPRPKLTADQCWFCLNNADLEKHLIVTVGERAYIAMPKGPLTEDHVLLLPVDHVQSLTAADQDLRDEIGRLRDACALMADAAGKVIVVFERNYRCQHAQINVVPVPKTRAKALRDAFIATADEKGFELTALRKGEHVWDAVNEGRPYFYVELPDGSRFIATRLTGFPLQFGREVLADPMILDCEEMIDWKEAALGKEKETEVAAALATRLKQYLDSDANTDSD